MTGRRLVWRPATSSRCSTSDRRRLIDTASLSAGDQAFGIEEAGNSPPGREVDDEQAERESDRERDEGRDDLEGDERCEGEQGQSGEGGELLGDADIPRSGGDGDADPDRPEGEERNEQELGEELGGCQTTLVTTWAAATRTLIRTTK